MQQFDILLQKMRKRREDISNGFVFVRVVVSVYIQIAHGQEGGDLIFCLKAIIILCHAGGP